MKNIVQIQRAHDLMVSILIGEHGPVVEGETWKMMSAAASALCWVLGDESSHVFAQNLAGLEEDFGAEPGHRECGKTN